MKKNLRIVSAAAAALLAVAPVAVSAAAVTSATAVGSVQNISNGAKVNVKPNVTLNTSVPGTSVKTALNASFDVTVDGTTATSTFNVTGSNASSVDMWYNTKNTDGSLVRHNVTTLSDIDAADAGTLYKVGLKNVNLNFGTQNANKNITLVLPNENGNHFDSDASKLTLDVKTDGAGVAVVPYVVLGVYAKNFANPVVVEWYNSQTGATVTSGNVELNAGSDAGKMNVQQVAAAIANKYTANVLKNTNNVHFTYTTPSEIADQLKKQNIDVDAQGWFVAPKTFTVNYSATSAANDAASTLAVTVNVPNGKEVKPATVDSVSKRIMHNAYYYDKDAKRVGTDSVKRYNSVSVLPNTTTINGKTYYQVVENGQAVNKYINAANIDGTKRTLKHNAYVYASSKKRANKVVLKKGEVVTTYGASYTFKNGQKYYKIGDNTDKTYVKVANFR